MIILYKYFTLEKLLIILSTKDYKNFNENSCIHTENS